MTLFYARTTFCSPRFSIYAFFKRFYATTIRSNSYASRYREEQALSEDAEKCNAAKADPNARILLFCNFKPLLIKLREYTSVTKWHLYKDIVQMDIIAKSEAYKTRIGESVFVGLSDEGHPMFAAELTANKENVTREETEIFEKQLGGYFNSIQVPIVSEPTRRWSSLAIRGYSLLRWNREHCYSSRSGQRTERLTSGHVQKCSSTDETFYPQISPIVIVLLTHEDRCLLVRQSRFPPRMYSAVAGFCNVGESIEDAARRELAEEVGLCAKSVRYVGSESWPAPVPQIMLGCVAALDADVTPFSESIDIDEKEIETAKWFRRDEITAVLRNPWGGVDETRAINIRVPPKFAVGNLLLREWVREKRFL